MITIFTPTYNRAELLWRLFASIAKQSCKDLEWIIIDDGSEDDTESNVKRMIEVADFRIKYFFQKNRGKHVAHNKGVELAEGELFFCVDSDDFLADTYVIERILTLWKEHKSNDECAGIISLKALQNGSLLGKTMPTDIREVSSFALAHKYGCSGEKNYIFNTRLIRCISYPEFENEIFCPDSFICDKLSYSHTMLLHNHIDVICEYRSDGLSKRFKKLMRENPKGFCIANMQVIDLHERIIDRIFASIRYWAFFYLGKDDDIIYQGKHVAIVKLTKGIGWLTSIYYSLRLR